MLKLTLGKHKTNPRALKHIDFKLIIITKAYNYNFKIIHALSMQLDSSMLTWTYNFHNYYT